MTSEGEISGRGEVRRCLVGAARNSRSTSVSIPESTAFSPRPSRRSVRARCTRHGRSRSRRFFLATAAVRDHERASPLYADEVEKGQSRNTPQGGLVEEVLESKMARSQQPSRDGRRRGVVYFGPPREAPRTFSQEPAGSRGARTDVEIPGRSVPVSRPATLRPRRRGRDCRGSCSSQCRRSLPTPGWMRPTDLARSESARAGSDSAV